MQPKRRLKRNVDPELLLVRTVRATDTQWAAIKRVTWAWLRNVAMERDAQLQREAKRKVVEAPSVATDSTPDGERSFRPRARIEEPALPPAVPPAPDAAATTTAAIFAALMRIGIRGLVVGDPVLVALVQHGATEAEIVGVAQHGASTGRGNWGWVSAAVAGKRSDAARLGGAPGPPPPNGSAAPAPAVWKPPPDPPPETPEQYEQRQRLLSDAKMAALRAIQAKRNIAESPPENEP